MAYLPPHKRRSNSNHTTPTPTPASLSPSLKSLSLSSQPRGGGKIVHATGCVSRWWPVPPLAASGDGLEELRLEPFSCEAVERRGGGKPLALVAGGGEGAQEVAPWVGISERVLPDLVAAVGRASAEGEREGEEVKVSLVLRVGKVLFHADGTPISLDFIRKAAMAGDSPRNQIRKSFYTNVPSNYLKDIEQLALKKIGLAFDSSKEHYHVKVFDKHQHDSTISCKCTVREDGGLEIHKVELNQVRHLVVDISCLFKDLDLRLMLNTKRILKHLDAEMENSIKDLVSFAVIDPNVKGGLRWPLGKESVGERFSIVGVWHTKYRAFKNETVRLKLRHADRFDHRSSTGEVTNEVNLKLTGISQRVKDGDLEAGPLKEMLQSVVQMIWSNLLSYKMESNT